MDAVARACVGAGNKNVVLIGANLARQCIHARLVDENLVHSAPTLLRDGVRFFERRGLDRVQLEKIHAEETGPMATLRYRVISPPIREPA